MAEARNKIAIRRGTTPTVCLHVHADLTDMSVYVSFESLCTLVTKSGDDVTLEPDDEQGWTKVSVTLTQAETLRFKSGTTGDVQIRAAKRNGEVAFASRCGVMTVEKVLQDGIIR